MPIVGQRLLLVLGMSTAWLPVMERLLYPITFITGDKNDPMAYLLNVIFYISVIALTLALAIISHRFKRMPIRQRTEGVLLLTTGLCAALGILAIWMADLTTPAGSLVAALGVIAVAVYFPLHFVFWSSRMALSPSKYALTDAILSFAVTAFLFMLYGVLDLRVVSLGMALPAISAVLAYICAVKCEPPKGEILKGSALWSTGMFTLCLILLLLCNLVIAYFNNSARLHADMPYRWVSFGGDIVIASIVAALYLPGKRNRRPTMSAFSVVALAFVALLLLAVVMSGDLLQRGTIPLHCANAVLVVFGWLLIVRAANRRKLDLVSFMSFYLALAVIAPRFFQAIIMYGPNYITMFSQSMDRIVVVAVVLVLAVGFVLFASMKSIQATIDAAQKPGAGQTGAADSSDADLSGLSDEQIEVARRAARHDDVLDRLREEAALSDREMDVARLTLKNYSAKKTAETLYVSVNTVYSHLKAIYRKTGVHSREEFIALVDDESSDR